MASREYWKNRFEQLEKSQINKGSKYFHDLEHQYNKAAQEIEKELTKWYARLAVNNQVSMAEAKKMLTKNELEEFKWSVEEYIEKGRTLNYTDQWAKQLENASAKFHISRLEAMKLQTQQQIEVLYGNELDSFDQTMRDVYTEGYYRTGYEIQKGIGVGHNLMQLDERKIDKVMARPWAADGSNFSERIWKQRAQLVNELHTQITQSLIRGQSPEAAINAISEKFKVSKGQAGRLVMTETAFFHSAGQKDMFKEMDVEEYEIVATLDNRTSQICQDLDGTHRPMSEFEPGVTAPPFHCWCRSTTVPYFDDEFTEDEERAARDDEGNTYNVPSNMTYHEWKDKFVDGASENIKDGGKAEEEPENDDIVKKLNDRGIQINIEEAGKYEEEAIQNLNHLEKLLDEYDSTAVSYTVTSKSLAGTENGSAYMMNGKTSISVRALAYKKIKASDQLGLGDNQPLGVTYHEFAHSLSQSREKTDPEFWKEIRKIKKEYEGMRGKNNWFDSIKISDYASKDIDEFLAEAFTQAKLSDNPSPYSKQVLDVVDKYFKKDALEKIGVNSTITDADKKAIYDYMTAKSYVVNEKLRTGEKMSDDEQKFVSNLNDALNKMPKYEGNLQRSLYFNDEESVKEFMKHYEVGKPITYKEFLSTTKGESYNPEGQVQIFIQDAKNGKDISSLNEQEQEVLYNNNSVFDVINIVENEGIHYILLGEKNE